MVPFVELRVWTLYPGQFPGQVAADDHTDYMLEDPNGHMSVLIKKGERLAEQLREVRSHSQPRSSLKKKWLLWVSKRGGTKLVLLTKQALSRTVVALAEPVEALENHEKGHVLESINKASRLEFIARLAKKPFDGKTVIFVAYASTIPEY